jgi:hypothetical protein
MQTQGHIYIYIYIYSMIESNKDHLQFKSSKWELTSKNKKTSI